MRITSTIKWAVLAAVIIPALIFLQRSCSLYDEVSVLKGKHEALQAAYADADAKAKATIAGMTAEIEARDKAIAELNHGVVVIEGKIEVKDEKIRELEEEFAQLGENSGAKIVNLQAQVVAWKEKFTLAESIIADKDGIIFNLTAKYDSQVKISAEWEASYHRQVELNTACLERIKVMEGEWKGLRFGSKLKTYAIAAAAGWIVYSMVRK